MEWTEPRSIESDKKKTELIQNVLLRGSRHVILLYCYVKSFIGDIIFITFLTTKTCISFPSCGCVIVMNVIAITDLTSVEKNKNISLCIFKMINNYVLPFCMYD